MSERTPDPGPADTPETPEDEVMTELRAIRAAMWEEAGGTMDGLVALLRRHEAEERAAGRVFLTPSSPRRPPGPTR